MINNIGPNSNSQISNQPPAQVTPSKSESATDPTKADRKYELTALEEEWDVPDTQELGIYPQGIGFLPSLAKAGNVFVKDSCKMVTNGANSVWQGASQAGSTVAKKSANFAAVSARGITSNLANSLSFYYKKN